MTEREASGDDVGALAEQAMADKRAEMGSEGQARELYDVPTESAADLAQQQDQADEQDRG